MLEITAVAAEQYLAQVDQAVDAFLDRGEAARWRPVSMFPSRFVGMRQAHRNAGHLSVVLEKRHVVCGGLNAQYDAAFVVHLDLSLIHI